LFEQNAAVAHRVNFLLEDKMTAVNLDYGLANTRTYKINSAIYPRGEIRLWVDIIIGRGVIN
jgi:hypothetical protein